MWIVIIRYTHGIKEGSKKIQPNDLPCPSVTYDNGKYLLHHTSILKKLLVQPGRQGGFTWTNILY